MATKRSAPSIHPSRRDNVPVESRKRRKINPHPHSGKSFKKAHPVNDLKSQVRSLRRLLEHSEDLPANVRVEKERALQSAVHELDAAQRAKKRSDMISRWHKIRFFDRQKATKRLKRAKKALEKCEDEGQRAMLEGEAHDAQVDINYAIYYPLDVAYVPLFPSHRKQGDAEDGGDSQTATDRQGDVGMWQKVKQCAADGTLDALRNGRLSNSEVGQPGESSRDTKSAASRSNHVRKQANKAEEEEKEDGDESDGGFFE